MDLVGAVGRHRGSGRGGEGERHAEAEPEGGGPARHEGAEDAPGAAGSRARRGLLTPRPPELGGGLGRRHRATP